jgi:hypothetical protein
LEEEEEERRRRRRRRKRRRRREEGGGGGGGEGGWRTEEIDEGPSLRSLADTRTRRVLMRAPPTTCASIAAATMSPNSLIA